AINGANERYAYVPEAFVFDPEEDEEPPPLLGGIPIAVPAQSTVSGVFREDQVREAALDLELITRSGENVFQALLVEDEELSEITAENGGPVPVGVTSSLVRFDIDFSATEHMVLEYAVRVRDFRGIVHDLLLDAPAGELSQFAPMDFAPPPPVDEP
ncbi:MAG TPA: hypothetical protein VFG83_10465, partial [Kofleriaceae bacterium]|nr:hypothetical protein [Kofleriaceae bacterium]